MFKGVFHYLDVGQRTCGKGREGTRAASRAGDQGGDLCQA